MVLFWCSKGSTSWCYSGVPMGQPHGVILVFQWVNLMVLFWCSKESTSWCYFGVPMGQPHGVILVF